MIANGVEKSQWCLASRRIYSFCTELSRAVSEHKPVSVLEEIRHSEMLLCTRDKRYIYSVATALRYAIVYDHLPYARYLLKNLDSCFVHILEPLSLRCHRSAPLLETSVHLGRSEILALLLEKVNRCSNLNFYVNQRLTCLICELDLTALHLACEMRHTDVMLILLGSGASPYAEDHDGMTPLARVLVDLCNSQNNVRDNMLCLDVLLMFMPQLPFKTKDLLERNAPILAEVLGEDKLNYMLGNNPAPLSLVAMQKVLAQLPSDQFLKRLDKLPIPESLKPLQRTVLRWRSFF